MIQCSYKKTSRFCQSALVCGTSSCYFGRLSVFGFFSPTVEFRVFDDAGEISEYYDDFDFDKFGEYESISNYKYYSMAIFSQEAYTTIYHRYPKEMYLIGVNNETKEIAYVRFSGL